MAGTRLTPHTQLLQCRVSMRGGCVHPELQRFCHVVGLPVLCMLSFALAHHLQRLACHQLG